MGKLTVIGIRSLTKPGRYTDGNGLHLHIRSTGRKTWVLRYMRNGKMRDVGLGSVEDVGLATARSKAAGTRAQLAAGLDPVRENARARDERLAPKRTFRAAAEHVIASKAAGWRNAKHGAQWTATLATYVYPAIGDRHVQDVTTADVLGVLQPIWATKTETASRVRGRIEAVLDAAKTLHWREGDNPARWKGHLVTLLPAPARVRMVEHHPSLPWRQMPAFLAALRARPGSSARAIEFAVLTAARSGEVRGLTRRELNFEARMWTVPRERMKSGRAHRVPLSAAALALLETLDVKRMEQTDLIFPGARKVSTALSDMSLTMVLRRLNAADAGQDVPWVDGVTSEPITVHGFRSTFRVWAGEETSYSREVIEHALSHVVGEAVEAAYARTDLLEKRRALMEEWGAMCTEDQQSKSGLRPALAGP